jgi:Late competence development protein ComFB
MANLKVRKTGTYINVMELLVKEEVEIQLGTLQARNPRFLAQINQTELVALAMNHLPALYATSKKGVQFQRQTGKTQYAAKIRDVVHRAIATVLKDPLRSSEPIEPQGSESLQETLNELRSLLRNPSINWDNLPVAIERALKQAQEGTVSRTSRQAVYAAVRTPGYRRPDNYSKSPSSNADITVPLHSSAADNSGWNDYYR